MKIALWQTAPRNDIDTALDALNQAAGVAAAEGADLIVTPELYVGGYNIGRDLIAAHAAQSADVITRLQIIAQTSRIALVAGLALPHVPLPHNACIAFDKTGVEMARYHKTHLYGDVDQEQFTPGKSLSPLFEVQGWKCALAICYDIEFPEFARALALQGAELIVTPTANMAPFDSVATRLVPARAEENALYVAYCNYVGVENPFSYNGLSCLSGPDGKDVIRGTHSDDHLLYGSIDRTALSAARKVQTHLKDRRPDLYGEHL